jgi:hypothetical protein
MTGIGDIQSVGNLIGALLNGYFTQKYGHRKVMLGNLVLMTGFVFITFFAQNITMLLIEAFLCSIPWGVFATMGPAYAAEVCRFERLFDCICEFVLGYWAVVECGYFEGVGDQYYAVEVCSLPFTLFFFTFTIRIRVENANEMEIKLLHPLCRAMDLAHPTFHSRLVLARIPLVPRVTKPPR